jgi:outer membrane protein assembly factor BamD
MDKTADMYEKIIQNGPYTDISAQAQMKIGQAHENKRGLFKKAPDNFSAAKAYERAADRYYDRKEIAADATFKQGLAYMRQSQTAEYDQNAANMAVATFTDFITLFPEDPRVPEARKNIELLRTEQARGSFQVAKFYDKRKRYEGARIYYNECLAMDPKSPYAETARKRLEVLNKLLGPRQESAPADKPAASAK